MDNLFSDIYFGNVLQDLAVGEGIIGFEEVDSIRQRMQVEVLEVDTFVELHSRIIHNLPKHVQHPKRRGTASSIMKGQQEIPIRRIRIDAESTVIRNRIRDAGGHLKWLLKSLGKEIVTARKCFNHRHLSESGR